MGGSSSKGGGGSKSYNYFGTIAGLVGVGPFDELFGFEVDDKILWSGNVLRESSPNPYIFSIPGRGVVHFYWGTEDQTPAPLLQPEKNSLKHAHPAYAGQAYFILVDFLFGEEKTMAPGIRVFARRKPQQSIVTGACARLNDGQANPVAVAAELLTSERAGLGWGSDMLARESWQMAADTAQANAQMTGVSPRIDRQSPAKSTIVDMLDMCDGFLRTDIRSGLCELGLYPSPEQVNTNALPVITSDNLTAPPEFSSESWDDVTTCWVGTYSDREKNFKERSVKHDDPRARYSGGKRRAETISRPHIVRATQMLAQLREHARRLATPGLKGNVSARSAALAALRPGAHVYVDIDPEPGGEQLRQVFRVPEIVRTKKGDVKLTLESERTLAPVAFIPPPSDPVDPPLPPAAVPEVAQARFFECPPALAENKNYSISVLASRSSGLVTDFQLYYDNRPDELFPLVGGARSFALRGQLAEAVDSSRETLSVLLFDDLSREIISENPGGTAARDDALLMFILRSEASGQIKADDENKAYIEVCSCVEFVASGQNRLNVQVLRSRRGTPARVFSPGDEVWFIRRDALSVISHADFAGLAANNRPAYFKLQPGEMTRQRPLEDCSILTFSFALARDLPVVADSKHVERRYARSNLKPSRPAKVATPGGWSLDMPSGSGCVWCSDAYKRDVSNEILSDWTDPIRVDGRRDFFQPNEPIPHLEDLHDGDMWWDTDDDNKMYRWESGHWVASFVPMVKTKDGLVYGLQNPDGSTRDFVLVAEKFQIWDGQSASCPFEISGGRVYLKDALIEKLSVGKLTGGEVEALEVVLSGANAVIRSKNYDPHGSGFKITGDGWADFARVVIRDVLQVNSLPAPTIDPPPCMYSNAMLLTPKVPAGCYLNFTLDGTPVTQYSPQWKGGRDNYQADTIDATTTLRMRVYDDTGRCSDEVIGVYVREGGLPQAATPTINPVGLVKGIAASVYFSCATADVQIWYQINSAAAIKYTGGNIAIVRDDYVIAYATKANYKQSPPRTYYNTTADDSDIKWSGNRYDLPVWILP